MTDAITGAGPPDAVASAGERVEASLNRLFEGCNAASVFGEPREVDGKVYITASAVQKAGAFGFGGGGGVDEKNFSMGSGGGGGGGGQADGRAIAIIEITPDGVQVKPVLDFTRIGITIIAAAITVVKALRS